MTGPNVGLSSMPFWSKYTDPPTFMICGFKKEHMLKLKQVLYILPFVNVIFLYRGGNFSGCQHITRFPETVNNIIDNFHYDWTRKAHHFLKTVAEDHFRVIAASKECRLSEEYCWGTVSLNNNFISHIHFDKGPSTYYVTSMR